MRPLLTQNFLRGGGTLTQLYQIYDIDCIESVELGVIGFNYRNMSPLADPMVCECRGLILEKTTWDVVCRSMDAFFPLWSPLAESTLTAFEWDGAYASEKCDGAIICLYFYRDAWRVASRVNPDGQWRAFSVNGAPHQSSWEELVRLTLTDMGTPWDSFISRLDKDIFYSFELCGPETRVGVVYSERTLTLIAAIARNTLEEIDIYELSFPDLKVKQIPVSSLQEAQGLVDGGYSGVDLEGYVVKDKKFRRFKVINPVYMEQQQAALRESEQEQIKSLRTYMMLSSSMVLTESETEGSGMGPLSLFSNSSVGLLSRLVRMTGATSIEYGRIMDFSDKEFELAANKFFWPEGLKEMRTTGRSVTDIAEAMPDTQLQLLLVRYESQGEGVG